LRAGFSHRKDLSGNRFASQRLSALAVARQVCATAPLASAP